MSTGIGTDFKIYQEYINGRMFEVVMQFLDVFNAGSNGAIQLVPEALKGDYDYESFFLEGADVARRDPDSVSGLTDNAITQEEIIGVKLHRTFHRALTRNQWLRIGQDPQQFARVYGGQLARKMIKEEVNTCIAATSAAISAVAALNKDGTAGTMTHTLLNAGLAKFGDAASNITALVMHSKPWFDLVGSAISSALLEVGGVAVNQGTTGTMGRPVIVTDSPALVLATSPVTYATLGLVKGACSAKESEAAYTADSGDLTGLANIIRRLQTEWTYNLHVKGTKYDVSSGGKNPDATAVATSSNWDQVVTDNKSMPGIRITSQ